MAVVVRHGKNSKYLGLREIAKTSENIPQSDNLVWVNPPQETSKNPQETAKTDEKSEGK